MDDLAEIVVLLAPIIPHSDPPTKAQIDFWVTLEAYREYMKTEKQDFRLEKSEIVKIVDIQLARLAKRLKDQDIEMIVTDAGYDSSFGARPLKRAIIRLVETPLSRKLLAGEIPPGKLTIDVSGRYSIWIRCQGFRRFRSFKSSING